MRPRQYWQLIRPLVTHVIAGQVQPAVPPIFVPAPDGAPQFRRRQHEYPTTPALPPFFRADGCHSRTLMGSKHAGDMLFGRNITPNVTPL